MRFQRFILRRIVYMIVQLVGAITVAFFLIRLIPGNPAIALAGAGASEDTVKRIEEHLGLDKPVYVQYGIYVQNLLRGDLGKSIYTGQPVANDLRSRIPATLELITIAMFIAVVVGIPLGLYVGLRMRGQRIINKALFVYGMLTGAVPDFWLGLILIFVFFFLLGWAPAPMGRFPPLSTPPPAVTNFLIIDSLLAGDGQALITSLRYLTMPVLTLVIIYMGAVVKMARASMEEALQSVYIDYARACGLTQIMIMRYALRNALAPVVTVIASQYGFLLGGAVLVEKVFAWGGLGQYAVLALQNGDYAPISGFILVTATYLAVIYLLLDICYTIIDPRIKH